MTIPKAAATSDRAISGQRLCKLLYGESGGKAAWVWEFKPPPTTQTGCNIALWNASHLPTAWEESQFIQYKVPIALVIDDDPATDSFVEKVRWANSRDYVKRIMWKDEPNLYLASPPSMSHLAARKIRQYTSKPSMLIVACMVNQPWDERDYLGVVGQTTADDAFSATYINYYKSVSSADCSWHSSTEEYMVHLTRMSNRYNELGYSKTGPNPRVLGVLLGALNNPVCPGEFSTLSLQILIDQTNQALSVNPAYDEFGIYVWNTHEMSGRSVGLIEAPQNREIVNQWSGWLGEKPSTFPIDILSEVSDYLDQTSVSVRPGENLTVNLLSSSGTRITGVTPRSSGIVRIAGFGDTYFTLRHESVGATKIDVSLSTGATLTLEASSVAVINVSNKRQALWDFPGTYYIGYVPSGVQRITNKPIKTGEIFNPSSWELWKNSDNKPNMIGPGGTVRIDPETGLIICWYTVQQPSPPAPPYRFTAYATSSDLAIWDKPMLGGAFFGGTYDNNLLPITEGVGVPIINTRPGAPASERFIAFTCVWGEGIYGYKSADGKNWGGKTLVAAYTADGSITGGWDADLNAYAFYIRGWIPPRNPDRRCVIRIVVPAEQLFTTWPAVPTWSKWGSSYQDAPDGTVNNLAIPSGTRDIYGMGFSFYGFDDNLRIATPEIFDHPLNHVWLGFVFSRDKGATWNWQDGDALGNPFIPNGGGFNDGGSIYASGLIRYGDYGHFIYSGSNAVHDGVVWDETGRMYAAKMVAGREAGYKFSAGTLNDLQIWPAGQESLPAGIVFSGKYLVINAKIAAGGKLGVHLTNDTNTAMIPGHGPNDIVYIDGPVDKRSIVMKWSGGNDLSSLAGQAIRLRIRGQDCEVYEFQFADSLLDIQTGSSCEEVVAEDKVIVTGETKTFALVGVSLSAKPVLVDPTNTIISVESWTQASITIKAGNVSGFAAVQLTLADGTSCEILFFCLPGESNLDCFS